MHRTAIGVITGTIMGAVCGIGVGQLLARPPWGDYIAVELGAILGAGGAIAGAVVGGVADILAFLRQALLDLDLSGGPEADYREPKSASPPGP